MTPWEVPIRRANGRNAPFATGRVHALPVMEQDESVATCAVDAKAQASVILAEVMVATTSTDETAREHHHC